MCNFFYVQNIGVFIGFFDDFLPVSIEYAYIPAIIEQFFSIHYIVHGMSICIVR